MPADPIAPATHALDAAIVGGGVAGLWLLNLLHRRGYRVALFESTALEERTDALRGQVRERLHVLARHEQALRSRSWHWASRLCPFVCARYNTHYRDISR